MSSAFNPVTIVDITPSIPEPNDWVTIDLSSYVPAGATGAIIHIHTETAPEDIGWHKTGSTDTDVWAGEQHFWTIVGLDASRQFDLYQTYGNRITIDLVGYTDSNVTMRSERQTISPTAGSWQETDLSSYTGDDTAIGAIFMIDTSNFAKSWGARMNGSTDTRSKSGGACGFVVGLDDNQKCELYRETTNVTFYLMGYITGGVSFYKNAVELDPGADSAWLEFEETVPTSPSMAVIEIISGSSGDSFGLRKGGTSEDIFQDLCYGFHSWGIVAHTGGIIEAKRSVGQVTFWLLSSAPSVLYPSDATTRVTSLTHRYDRGTYTLEVHLGEVVADFGLPEWISEPEPFLPGVGDYACPYCDATFTSAAALWSHVQFEHLGGIPGGGVPG